MNSASTHHTTTKAGRKAHVASRVVLACALVQALVLGLGVSPSAYAQQHDRRDDGGYPQERHSERFQLPPQDREQRMAEMRAYEEQRRAQQQFQQQYQQQYQQERDRNRGGSRLTPDERRDLRRQINEANMDLYPQRR